MIIYSLDFIQGNIGMNMPIVVVNLFILPHSYMLLNLPIQIPFDGLQQGLSFLLYIRHVLLSLKFFI